MLLKTARRVAAVRRYDRAKTAYRYHQRLGFGRLAVERRLRKAERLLAGGEQLRPLARGDNGSGDGLY